MSTPLPEEITYGNNFRPKGYYTSFKEWPIAPMSSNQYWTPDEIVRFLINVKTGVMDPYRSHIEILVTVPPETPVGGLQVDNSAQGFISQSVVSSNNIEIERITDYDTLAAYLTDIGFSEFVCESRVTEGLGFSNITSHQPWLANPSNQNSAYFTNTNTENNFQMYSEINSPNLTLPVTMPLISGRGPSGLIVGPTGAQKSNVTRVSTAGEVSTPLSITNVLLGEIGTQEAANTLTYTGRFNAIRSEYATNMLCPNYPDIGTSLIHTSPTIKNQTYNIETFKGNNTTSGFNPKAPYLPAIEPKTYYNNINPSTLESITVNTPNICGLYGYQRPISGEFCRGTNETILSPTILQCQMQDGNILPQKIPVSSQLFRIPLISSICGILIPPDQFLLIPMEALYNLLLEITLSRFAMFTTGYCDVHEYDGYGMSFMQPRKWVISEIFWNMHLYTFADSEINRQIEASLVKTIPISTTTYALASQFQIPNGQVVRNSWPVATQSESLSEIICIFLSNEYNQYSFCRKQFRLSNNISSMQIKFGTEYFPSQPIIGNAGNPSTLDTTGDAWPFYEQLLLSSNFLFNTNLPTPKINIKNFAINGRCYNANNKNTFLDPSLSLYSASYVYSSNSINTDTALGQSHFHENRYIGKAAYVYTWEPYGHSKNYMNGLNTQGVQNFYVIFNTTGKNPFPTDQTLYIFTRSNAIVIYTNNGIKVLGK